MQAGYGRNDTVRNRNLLPTAAQAVNRVVFAEEETRRAADLAANPFQLAMARQQMMEIRTLQHTSVRNVEWTKPLTVPTVALSAMLLLMFVIMMWK